MIRPSLAVAFVSAMQFLTLWGTGSLAGQPPAPGQLSRDVEFETPSPLAANDILLRRLMSPRQAQRLLATLAAKGQALAPFSVDPKAERFSVYVPKRRPEAGYGLLVFIPPWEDGRLPTGWADALDRAGVIFVSAQRSGNDDDIAGRRAPLALTAAYGLGLRYPIDPERTFVGGFSGGSRVALRMILAYPDVFSGVLLNSGADPIGGPDAPLPSADLMARLQTRTRFVFATGEHDEINLAKDAEARLSLSHWCIVQTVTLTSPHAGHEVLDGGGLLRALQALNPGPSPHAAPSPRCLAALAERLERARSETRALLAQPPSPKVDGALDRLDAAFGALLAGSSESSA
jgi:pimeloyl-ACP methyl ester carboxylesterase